MSSNLILLFFLLAGFLLALINRVNLSSIVQKLLVATIIVLVFMMGANLGMMQDLSIRIASYGYSALVVTLSAILFSIMSAWVFVRLFMSKDKQK